nr:9166_t:CDS:2 [Entrophospora candida]
MLSKSFKFLTFALLIITILSNVFINASPILSEKRAKDGVAYASFDNGGDVKKISGLIRFPQISKETTRVVGLFTTGFTSENPNDYGFDVVDGCCNVLFDLISIRDQLSINPPGTGAFEFDIKLQVKQLRNSGLDFHCKLKGPEIKRAQIKLV